MFFNAGPCFLSSPEEFLIYRAKAWHKFHIELFIRYKIFPLGIMREAQSVILDSLQLLNVGPAVGRKPNRRGVCEDWLEEGFEGK